ncbi:5934_t:CDS:1, partial [Cetraspora pellucida]
RRATNANVSMSASLILMVLQLLQACVHHTYIIKFCPTENSLLEKLCDK